MASNGYKLIDAAAESAEKFLTPSQLAHHYGVHPATVVRWFTRGGRARGGKHIRPVGVVKYPGGWRATRQSVDDFLKRLTEAAQPEPSEAPAEIPAERPESVRAAAALSAAGW